MEAELQRLQEQFNAIEDYYISTSLKKDVKKSLGSHINDLSKDLCECTSKSGILCGPNSSCCKRESGIECRLSDHTCDNQIVTKSGSQPVKSLELFSTEVMGIGVRTQERIAANSYVLQYVGEIRTKDEYLRLLNNVYGKEEFYGLFLLENSEKYVIDPTTYGNIGRYINSSHAPNLETKIFYIKDLPVVTFWSNRLITKGEELFFNYRAVGVDFLCKCNVCCPLTGIFCSTCGKPFKFKSLLEKHAIIHAPVKEFYCVGCGQSFGTDQYLLKHYREVHLLKIKNTLEGDAKPFCSFCGVMFNYPVFLDRHYEQNHPQIKKDKVCSVCDKSFYTEKSLSEHAEIHALEMEKAGQN